MAPASRTVILAAGRLQQSGLIEYRERIHCRDHEGLESAAFECYLVCRHLVADLYQKL
jgi:hypothetical protein